MNDEEIGGFGDETLSINIDDALLEDGSENEELYTADALEEDEEY